jgi:hypothetical protein
VQKRLNRRENWSGASSVVFYGTSGEIAANRFVDQEIFVLDLHLFQAIGTSVWIAPNQTPRLADRLKTGYPSLISHLNWTEASPLTYASVPRALVRPVAVRSPVAPLGFIDRTVALKQLMAQLALDLVERRRQFMVNEGVACTAHP